MCWYMKISVWLDDSEQMKVKSLHVAYMRELYLGNECIQQDVNCGLCCMLTSTYLSNTFAWVTYSASLLCIY